MISQIGYEVLWITMVLSLIPLIPCAVGGLLISIFQAVTQVQEQTASQLGRVLLGAVALYFAGPLIVSELSDLFIRYFQLMQQVH